MQYLLWCYVFLLPVPCWDFGDLQDYCYQLSSGIVKCININPGVVSGRYIYTVSPYCLICHVSHSWNFSTVMPPSYSALFWEWAACQYFRHGHDYTWSQTHTTVCVCVCVLHILWFLQVCVIYTHTHTKKKKKVDGFYTCFFPLFVWYFWQFLFLFCFCSCFSLPPPTPKMYDLLPNLPSDANLCFYFVLHYFTVCTFSVN